MPKKPPRIRSFPVAVELSRASFSANSARGHRLPSGAQRSAYLDPHSRWPARRLRFDGPRVAEGAVFLRGRNRGRLSDTPSRSCSGHLAPRVEDPALVQKEKEWAPGSLSPRGSPSPHGGGKSPPGISQAPSSSRSSTAPTGRRGAASNSDSG